MPLKPDHGTLKATCTTALSPQTDTKFVLDVTWAVYPRLNITSSASSTKAESSMAESARACSMLSTRAWSALRSFLVILRRPSSWANAATAAKSIITDMNTILFIT